MPVKNETKLDEHGSPEAVAKQKKTRYSLKKLLDRSRFSPRLLRIPRLLKSTDGDQELDTDLKTSCLNANGDSVTGSENNRSTSQFEPSFKPQLASSVPLDATKQLLRRNSNRRTPTALSSPENAAPENPLEEDYEASLTQFADLIIEGFKNSPTSRAHQPIEPHSQTSVIACTDPQNSGGPLWLPLHAARLAHHVNEQLTPPLQFDSIHRLSSAPALPHTESGAIYNEPCDAKPSDDPVTIYTVSGFANEAPDDSNQCSSKESPHSSHSSGTDTDARALSVTSKALTQPSIKDPLESNVNRTEDRCSSGESENRSSSVNSHGRSGTPCRVSSTSPTPPHGQLGFVDAPRGNSVIVHHPTSPFARVPRGALPSTTTSIPGTIETNTRGGDGRLGTAHSCTQPLSSCSNTQEPSNLRLVVSARSGPSTLAAGPANSSTSWKNSVLNSPITDPGHRSRANVNDSHPTYEEAWDLKMARQLGFGIPRLTPVPAITSSVASGTPTGIIDSTAAPISGSDKRLAAVTCSKSRQHTLTQPAAQPIPTAPSVTRSTKSRTHSNKHHPSGLIFHENRMFDQSSHALKSSDGVCPEPSSTTSTEYDYAYNGSWSMGVKLNLNLAINGASEKAESSSVPPGPIVASGSVSNAPSGKLPLNTNQNRLKSIGPPPSTSLVPPQVPAHQNQRMTHVQTATHVTDGTRLKHPMDSGLAFSEFDNASTDSYEESWEARHGRVVSELTNSRFVDPSALILTKPISSCSSVHSVGQPLSVLTNAIATPEPHQRPGYCGDGQHYPGTSPTQLSSIDPGTPTGSGISSTVYVKSISPSLELLPLEEQPWFHRSLTRSEAEDLLRNQPEGSFLVRNSETCPNDYSLTIKHKTFLHMKISRNPSGQYILGEYSQPYATVPQMIYHYARTLVPVRGAESVTLIHPVCNRFP